MNDVTNILNALEHGDRVATDQLLPLVYDELRKLAAQKLVKEPSGQTLQPTALVHEVYLRLIGPGNAQGFASRRHFFGAAAEAMRRILVEQARYKQTLRAGGQYQRADQGLDELASSLPQPEILAVHEVLDQLAAYDPLKAELVKLRYFAGCTNNEAAELLQITPKSAEKHWVYARAWLQNRLDSDHL